MRKKSRKVQKILNKLVTATNLERNISFASRLIRLKSHQNNHMKFPSEFFGNFLFAFNRNFVLNKLHLAVSFLLFNSFLRRFVKADSFLNKIRKSTSFETTGRQLGQLNINIFFGLKWRFSSKRKMAFPYKKSDDGDKK